MTTETATDHRLGDRWDVATTRPIRLADGTYTIGNSKRLERLTEDVRALALHVAGEALVTEAQLDALGADVEAFLKARVLQLAGA